MRYRVSFVKILDFEVEADNEEEAIESACGDLEWHCREEPDRFVDYTFEEIETIKEK